VDPDHYHDMLARDLAAAKAVKPPIRLRWWSGRRRRLARILFRRRTSKALGRARISSIRANPIDRNAHGGVPWIEYFLQQMQAASNQAGTRLLDYLDVHGYVGPALRNDCSTSAIAFGTAVDPASTASACNRRGRSGSDLHRPRGDDPNGFQPVRRLQRNVRHRRAAASADADPRMIGWVNQYLPGTKTAITEYELGRCSKTSPARWHRRTYWVFFGAYGLDMATMWPDTSFKLGVPARFRVPELSELRRRGQPFRRDQRVGDEQLTRTPCRSSAAPASR